MLAHQTTMCQWLLMMIDGECKCLCWRLFFIFCRNQFFKIFSIFRVCLFIEFNNLLNTMEWFFFLISIIIPLFINPSRNSFQFGHLPISFNCMCCHHSCRCNIRHFGCKLNIFKISRRWILWILCLGLTASRIMAAFAPFAWHGITIPLKAIVSVSACLKNKY